MQVVPRTAAPALAFDTVSGDRYDLAARAPGTFTLLVVYRGHH